MLLAKHILPENKDVAAVLICAALEDALKSLGLQYELDVASKEMAEVISALATAGVVQGPQLSTVRSFTKLRNKAFHAEWNAVDAGTVSSAVSFTEEFLKQKFHY